MTLMAQTIRSGWVLARGGWHRVDDGKVWCGASIVYAWAHEIGTQPPTPGVCDKCLIARASATQTLRAHAREKARPDCDRCKGTGDIGTFIFIPCQCVLDAIIPPIKQFLESL